MTRPLLAALFAALGLLGPGALDGAAGTSPPRGPDPGELWEEFPLDEGGAERGPTTPTVPRRPPAERPEVAADESSSSGWLVALAGAAAFLLSALAFWALRGRSRRREPAPDRGFNRNGRVSPEAILAAAQLLALEAAECDRFTLRSRELRGEDVSEQSEVRGMRSPQAVSPARAYTDIGERVAGVLRAAEEAAEQIKADARDEASDLRREAEDEAEARSREAADESEHLRTAAERYATDTRGAVDSYATQHRREAEEEAARTLAEAETQARATREAAEQMAKRIEAEGRTRQQTLFEESRSVEARLQRALAGFRHMTTQLEELLEGPPRANGESLVEALELERRRQPAG